MAYVTNNFASFSISDEYDSCVVEFKLSGDSVITITQKNGLCMTGLNVTYTGKYLKRKTSTKISEKEQTLIDLGILRNEREDSIFRKIVGNKYSLFINSTQVTSEDEDLDSLNARVISSGVTGLFTYMENIIMVDSLDNLWAAVIEDNKVLYYTNRKNYSNKLPRTIENWRKNFEHYEIIYQSK